MEKSADGKKMPPPPSSATRLLEICRVTPPPDSTTHQISLPLTFFDTKWLKFPPVEQIFFYRLSAAAATSSEFHAAVLPRLKRSLSLALSRFLPLAGNLTWPADADVPFILYSPGDGVSVTIAESDDDFDLLSGDGPHDATLSSAYVPKLAVSASSAAVLALQVTLFPSEGFCIGVTAHHAGMDGKSAVMFFKAWAHISSCKGDDGSLPEELTPFLDRTGVKDPEGIALDDLATWMAVGGGEDNPKSLEILPEAGIIASKSDLIRRTFKLSKQEIEKLRQSVIRHDDDQLEDDDRNDNNGRTLIRPFSNYLSTFVITYAYTLVCVAKAKGLKGDKVKAMFRFSADCRSRLEPPLPSNYFGNCIVGCASDEIPIGDLVHHEAAGFASAVHKLVEAIRRLEKGVLVGRKGKVAAVFRDAPAVKEGELFWVAVAGSPRFGFYGVDFGYGRPEKVEIVSIVNTAAMSMAESGDGSSGVEVGLVMKKHEMDKFTSAFCDGLK